MYKYSRIQNRNTFRFFNYKWKKVPQWASKTEKDYVKWYLKRYNFTTIKKLKNFLKNKMAILDAGCGLGRDSKLFAKLNTKAKVYGCDQSLTSLKYARKKLKKYKNLQFFQQDITRKFEIEEKFDFISCDQVLHHTPSPGKTLKNLFSMLNKNGYLNFFVCKKKNSFRDFIDDQIMHHFRDKSPQELWKFSKICTLFAKALYELKINNIKFQSKKYNNLQEFIHYNSFRTWYNPNIAFDLSLSSNYDWFSNNPRYSQEEIKNIAKKSLKKFKFISIVEDNASISIMVKKI